MHSQFNRLFREYKVREQLVQNDYRERMASGDFFYIPTEFGHIVCFGVTHTMTMDDVKAALDPFESVVSGEKIVFFDGFKKWVPGAEYLSECIANMNAGLVCQEWDSFKRNISQEKEKDFQ
ncbi:hypothetical protein [Alteromonas sp. 14N.309.X.WAT.G.H12]|uniref:hypothetical protein n=1 Tax=Alteromonas sp. 14N.309.X.WAT.G.H12 TaxID=3120824 RepID=UPI002FD5AD8F